MRNTNPFKTALFNVAYPAFKSGRISTAKWRHILNLLAMDTSPRTLGRNAARIAAERNNRSKANARRSN